MQTVHTELSGVIVPIITPVDEEDRVDEASFRRAIRRLIGAGVQGLFVGGSGGEGPLLTFHEWQRMVEIAQDENRDAVALLGGVVDTSTQRIKERIKVLADIGYAWFVVTPTFYVPLKVSDEHLRLFSECAAAGRGMSMIAYNIPQFTNSEIPIEVVLDLCRRGLIKYCKESSSNLSYFKQMVAAGAPLGLKVFMGDELNMAAGWQAGACGIVPGSANVEPKTFIRQFRAAQQQDWAEVARVQERILALRANLPLAGSNWIAGIKYGVSCMGIGSGRPVSPLQPLSDEQKRTVEIFCSTMESC
jgi:4-hydroxy-tetrahydrodipicolinate synthase